VKTQQIIKSAQTVKARSKLRANVSYVNLYTFFQVHLRVE